MGNNEIMGDYFYCLNRKSKYSKPNEKVKITVFEVIISNLHKVSRDKRKDNDLIRKNFRWGDGMFSARV